jgi:hypothetical protein
MILDDEKQRGLLLELIRAATFPGEHIEMAVSLKRAIQGATLPAPSQLNRTIKGAVLPARAKTEPKAGDQQPKA